MKNQDLINIGFVYPKNGNQITNSVIYPLGRSRYLSVGSTGTPNEMLWIYSTDEDTNKITDLICLHNYDYDGFLSLEKVKSLVSILVMHSVENMHENEDYLKNKSKLLNGTL